MAKNRFGDTGLVYIIDNNFNLVYINEAFKVLIPSAAVGHKCYKTIQGTDEPCHNCPLRTNTIGKPIIHSAILDNYYDVSFSTMTYHGQDSRVVILNEVHHGRNQNLSIANIPTYDALFEADLSHDTFKFIYVEDGKLDIPYREGKLSEYINNYIAGIIHPDDVRALKTFWELYLYHRNDEGVVLPTRIEYRRRTIDGKYALVEYSVSEINKTTPDDQKVLCFVHEIGDSVKAKTKSTLNELYTKEHFLTEATQLFDKGDKRYCMIAIDIEHFQLFGEWYGKKASNSYVISVSKAINKLIKEYGGVGGYFGTDKFGLFIPCTDGITDVVETTILSGTKKFGSNAGFLPAFGVYPLNEEEADMDSVFDRAVLALSLAKGNYVTRSVVYDPNMAKKIVDEHFILSQVQKSLDEDEFTFYLQPQCDMRTGKIVGGEALVRWINDKRGMISPGEFIPVLEKNGFITAVDVHVWEKVCKWMRDWLNKGNSPFPISINISRLDFYLLDLPKHLKALVDKYDISPSLLDLEITESAYSENSSQILSTIIELRNLGFTIAMDDFGSGYSSLNMLKDMSLDILKIDMKFLSSSTAEKGVGIIESVVGMAKYLGLIIVVEGVESQEQVDMLLSLDCRYCQGYKFYRPLPIKEFENLVIQKDNVDPLGFQLPKINSLTFRKILMENVLSDQILDNILGVFAIVDYYKDKPSIVKVNDKYFQLTGVSSLETNDYAKTFSDYVYEDDRPALKELFLTAAKNRSTGSTADIRYLKPDGTKLYLLVSAYYLQNNAEHQIYFVSIKDVSDLRFNELQLSSLKRAILTYTKEDEEATFEKLPTPIKENIYAVKARMSMFGTCGLVCEPGLPFDFADSSLVGLLGYQSLLELQEATGDSFLKLVVGSSIERVEDNFIHSPELYKEVTTSVKLACKDGSNSWFLCKAKIVARHTDNKLVAVIILQDITDVLVTQFNLIERSDRLLDQSNRLKLEADDLPGAYRRVSLDDDLTLRFINNKFYKLIGYTHDEFKEQYNDSFLSLVHPGDRKYVFDQIMKSKNDPNFQTFVYRIRHKAGYYLYVRDHSRYVEINGQTYFQGLLADVTEFTLMRNTFETLNEKDPDSIFFMRINKENEVNIRIVIDGLSKLYGRETIAANHYLANGFKTSHKFKELCEHCQIFNYDHIMDKTDYSLEYPFTSENGEQYWISVLGVYTKESTEYKEFLFICSDITRLKANERAAELATEKLEVVFKLSNLNLFTWNLEEHTLTLQNNTSKNLSNVSPAFIPAYTVLENFPDRVTTNGALLPESHTEIFKKYVQAVASDKSGDTHTIELPLYKRNKALVWAKIYAKCLLDEKGNPTSVIGSFKDITHTKNLEIERNQSDEVLKLYNSQAIYDFKANLTKDTYTMGATSTDWYEETGIKNKTFSEAMNEVIQRFILPEYRDDFTHFIDSKRLIEAFNNHKTIQTFDYQRYYKGTPVWLRITVSLLKSIATDDIMAFVTMTDITPQKNQEIELQKVSYTDPITGLLNRAKALDDIREYLNTKPKEESALILFDVDNFKNINDVLGHEYGDSCLKKIAYYIKEMFPGAIVARFGGDEFMAFMKGPRETIAKKLQSYISSAVTSINTINNEFVLTISAGYAMYPKNATSLEKLIERAETALYETKINGKNGYREYNDSMKPEVKKNKK